MLARMVSQVIIYFDGGTAYGFHNQESPWPLGTWRFISLGTHKSQCLKAEEMDIFLFLLMSFPPWSLGPAWTFIYLFFKDSISSSLDWPQTLYVARGDLGTCFSVSTFKLQSYRYVLPPLLSAAADLCVLGVEVQAHTFPGDSQASLSVVRSWGRDADRDRSSPQRIPIVFLSVVFPCFPVDH